MLNYPHPRLNLLDISRIILKCAVESGLLYFAENFHIYAYQDIIFWAAASQGFGIVRFRSCKTSFSCCPYTKIFSASLTWNARAQLGRQIYVKMSSGECAAFVWASQTIVSRHRLVCLRAILSLGFRGFWNFLRISVLIASILYTDTDIFTRYYLLWVIHWPNPPFTKNFSKIRLGD